MSEELSYKGTIPATGGTMPILETLGIDQITLKPGELLTPHFHPNANELAHFLTGTAQVAVYSVNPSDPPATPFTVKAGEVVFFPQGTVHYVKNVGESDVTFSLNFDNPDFDVLFVTDIFKNIDSAVMEQAFDVNGKIIAAMQNGGTIVPPSKT